jgi:hypothetical protein
MEGAMGGIVDVHVDRAWMSPGFSWGFLGPIMSAGSMDALIAIPLALSF